MARKKDSEKYPPMSPSTREYAVGRGKVGLGKDELKRRMKQHKALADIALKRSGAASDFMKGQEKLIGMFGSAYTGDLSGMVQQRKTLQRYEKAQSKKAEYFKKNYEAFKYLNR